TLFRSELYALVSRMLGQDVRPEHKPDLAGEAETTHADIAKARALGWEPRVSLEAASAGRSITSKRKSWRSSRPRARAARRRATCRGAARRRSRDRRASRRSSPRLRA